MSGKIWFTEAEEWWYAVGSCAGYTGDSMGLRSSKDGAISALLESEWDWNGNDPGIDVIFVTKFTFTSAGILSEECEYSREHIVAWVREHNEEVSA